MFYSNGYVLIKFWNLRQIHYHPNQYFIEELLLYPFLSRLWTFCSHGPSQPWIQWSFCPKSLVSWPQLRSGCHIYITKINVKYFRLFLRNWIEKNKILNMALDHFEIWKWKYLPWAELISFFEFFNVFSKDFLALLACKDHLSSPHELVVIIFVVAFRAIIPFFAAWSSDWNLGVKNVFTHFFWIFYIYYK